MRVRAVDFAGIAVPEMAKAQAFYRDVLGLKALSEGETWAEYDAGNVAVSLVVMEDAGTGAPSMRNTVLALGVESVAQAVEEVRAKGAGILQEPAEYPPCFMAMVADPFGNKIMLHQRKDGTAG